MNNKNFRNKTLYVALGSIITALSVVIMLLTNIITIASMALPAVSGVLTAFLVIETNKKCAATSFAAAAILSFLFVTDKTSVLAYVLLFGYYPIVKSSIEKIKSKAVQFIIKLIIFNVCTFLLYWLSVKVLMLPEEEFMFNGVSLLLPLYILIIITLIAYDIAVTQLITRYIVKLKPYVDNILKIYR